MSSHLLHAVKGIPVQTTLQVWCPVKSEMFLNGQTAASFWYFQINITIFTTNQCKKMSCSSSTQPQDLNPKPFKHESSPITPRPEMFVQLVSMLVKKEQLGSGCGSVGRAVASYTRGPRFESSHRQKFIEHLFTVNCVLKRRK